MDILWYLFEEALFSLIVSHIKLIPVGVVYFDRNILIDYHVKLFPDIGYHLFCYLAGLEVQLAEAAEYFGSAASCLKETCEQVFSAGGRQPTEWEAVAWATRAVELGAGEIVLNSIDADGTKAGYDLEVTRRISEAVGVPVVASGGAGTLEHMGDVLIEGQADAVLAASIFHYGEYTVGEVKTFLAGRGIPVRSLPE